MLAWRTSGQSVRMGALLWVAVLAIGCSQAASPASTSSGGEAPKAARISKTLRLGMAKEPKDGILFLGTSTGVQDPSHVLHAGLTVYDQQDVLQPRLVERVPTVENGDWRVESNGRMEVEWRLRPGARWHDGVAVTVDDVALGLRVVQDNEIPLNRASWLTYVEGLRKVDDRTFVVVWKQPYILANASGPSDLAVLPNHILGDAYASGDKQAFINNSYWAQEFIGLGPYRMKEWSLGSHMVVRAFDDYFLGRAKIDELSFRFFTDVQPLIAALRAGEIDAIPVGSMKAEEAIIVKQAWDASGEGNTTISWNGLRILYFQYRDVNAPWVRDLRVRRALAHAQDRQTLVETLKNGLTAVGHTVPTPDDPLHKLIEQRGLTKYDYNPRASQQLLEEAGWTRGSSGIYQNAAGQPFTIEVRTVVVAPEALQEIIAEADQFKAAGLDSPIFQVRQADANRSELRAKAQGVFSNRIDDTPDAFSRFHSSTIASEANRWLGSNVWGYANPSFDRLYDQYIGTLEGSKRQQMQVEMLKMAADELTFIPMWYELGLLNMAVRKGVRGPVAARPIQQENMWNVHTWEID